MNPFDFDQDALARQFAEASARGGEALRKAVHDATLQALQGRELTLKNIRKAVQGVAQAASSGAAANPLGAQRMEPLLMKALTGMDAALLQAVEANHRALDQLVSMGASLRDNQLKSAMADLERMEDMFFDTVRKAVSDAKGGPMGAAWEQALDKMQLKGTGMGMQANQSLDDLADKARSALRGGRHASLKAAQALMDSYAALASGVLIGMTQGLKAGAAAAAAASDEPSAAPPPKAPARPRKRAV